MKRRIKRNPCPCCTNHYLQYFFACTHNYSQCHTHSSAVVKWDDGMLLLSLVSQQWRIAFAKLAGVYNLNKYLSKCWLAGRIKAWWETGIHMAAHAALCQKHWTKVTTPQWRGCFEQADFWIHLNRFLLVMALSKGCRPVTSSTFKGFSPK